MRSHQFTVLILFIFVVVKSMAVGCSRSERVSKESKSAGNEITDAELAFLYALKKCPELSSKTRTAVPPSIEFDSDICTAHFIWSSKANFEPYRITPKKAEDAFRLAASEADGMIVLWDSSAGPYSYYALVKGDREMYDLIARIEIDEQKQHVRHPGAATCMAEPDGVTVYYRNKGKRKQITEILVTTCDWLDVAGFYEGDWTVFLTERSSQAVYRFLDARKRQIWPAVLQR